ncbi:UdgX family uracil-DNA binding protein [Caenimonas aquaedulcis]|uniref:Type-4 uracil-DNA glycosylase n=1 Tax=Caenimonas aquaedulcis TaxID=2793270 RepID=A0A931H3D8_9BURK|nr:UdgX family uracil-DNA binding protein [Caenimonas aquaedulcis]MBG9387765.1 UdgX family uracil-DNA binding protein [Caenimonas aquaedulcis]
MQARLSGETDFEGFRSQARTLLSRGVAPEDVQWVTGDADGDLFAGDDSPLAPAAAQPGVAVPASFLELCKTVVLHRDPQRFALLYRLLWRLASEPALRDDPLDADMMRARDMARAVRRDIHKMHAFLRFREVPDAGAPGGVLHVAWFEPEHHIVEANAPWFMRRFTNMHWAILTPLRCVAWDGKALRFQPGARRADAPAADAGEQLWLTYYRSIFNPARLKIAMMQKEMPRKYWRNLPEAESISPLVAGALARSGTMVESAPTQARRTIRAIARPTPAPAAPETTLEGLRDAVQRCRECPIGALATQGVPGEGPQRGGVMLVGEQPGDQEDLRGRPFVGPAGQLLMRALAQAGLSREQVFLTNAVRHFKYEVRGKRRIHKTPSQAEAAACAHWLEREIALVQPRAIVALGATAARSLLQRPVAVMSERGGWHARADGLRVLVTLHPSALLRMPADEQEAALTTFTGDLGLAAALYFSEATLGPSRSVEGFRSSNEKFLNG